MSFRFLPKEALLTLLQFLTVCQCSSGDTWTQMQVQCLPEAAAFHQVEASSDVHCTVMASNEEKSGILVAQFQPVSLQCSLFRYQSVCRDLLSGASSDCRVLIRFPIKYPAQLSPKLTNVWLGDDMTRFENAVCQADEETNRIYPVGVQWTEEGAAFDGSSSHLALNKSDIGFGSGITVLLRMKRTPQVQPYFEFADCSKLASGPLYHHIWEFSGASRVYTLYKSQLPGAVSKTYMTSALLPANASEWIDLGFTASAMADSWGIFLNDKFLPSSVVTVRNSINFTPLSKYCFWFGRRHNKAVLFKGGVKAIAIGSSFINYGEIRDFFAKLP